MSLEFKNVIYSPMGILLLGPITLTIPKTGITCVTGPNGAGKSIFLQLAHGIIPPNSGQILWNGKPANLTKANRSYIFQRPILLRRSVEANLRFPLMDQHKTQRELKPLIQDALEATELTKLRKAPAFSLSGGEQQRLAFARAMITNPSSLLCDEPTSNLDPAHKEIIETLIKTIAAKGTKVILITHDFEQIDALATDTIQLTRGKIV